LPSLTADQYHEFCHKVFDSVQNDNPNQEKRFLPGHNREILRVTGCKNEQGEIMGVFGMPEFLPWHCNQPGIPLDQRPDCLTLYSVEHCKGSVTAFTNTVLALQDLRTATDAPTGLLDALDKLEVYYEYSVDIDQRKDNFDYVGHSGRNRLVVKNKSGRQGIMFSNTQTKSFWIDDEQVPDYLYQTWQAYLGKFLVQKKYVYAHRWQNNEMIMNCQVFGQHARLPFASIEKRLLWRIMGRVKSFDGSALTI
jgi:alpha-ketoglutarate-dependent taurine dioxygenase